MDAAKNKRSATGKVSEPQSDTPRAVYTPREDATPEGELAALAAVYAFMLNCHEGRSRSAQVSDDENRTEVGHAGESPE